MPVFSIQVCELSTKIINVQAETSEEAVEEAERMWDNSEIVMSVDDYYGKIIQDSDDDERIYLGFFE